MMERWPQFILFMGVFLTALTSVDANVKSVFVFGDSELDPGNNKYIKNCTIQSNFRPYGSAFFHYPTGRFTNGRTVADFIAQYLGIKFQKPYQEIYHHLAKNQAMGFPPNGLNFASAGSGLSPERNKNQWMPFTFINFKEGSYFMFKNLAPVVLSTNGGVTSLQVQLQQFQALIMKNSTHKHLHKRQIANSIFLLGSGRSDVLAYFLEGGVSKMRAKPYVRVMLKEVVRFTSKIYKYGGRRIVFFSLGPAGCVPARVILPGAPTTQCIEKMNIMARYFNAGLKRFIYNIPRMYPGAIGVYAGVYESAKKYRDNPKSYGFANITHACCGGGPLNGLLQCGKLNYKMCLNPNEYFFWDYFHPTEHTYGLISKAFWAGSKDEIWPVNLQTLAHKKIILPPHL